MTDWQPASGSSAIDLSVLEELARDAGAESLSELTDSFMRDCARREAEIEAEDMATLEAQSHALTSTARTFGVLALADLTHAVEVACRQGSADDALSRAAILPDVAAAGRQAITEQAKRYAASGAGRIGGHQKPRILHKDRRQISATCHRAQRFRSRRLCGNAKPGVYGKSLKG